VRARLSSNRAAVRYNKPGDTRPGGRKGPAVFSGGTTMRYALFAVLFALLTGSPAAAGDKNPVVLMQTSMGDIKIELFEKKAPITVKNFLKYVDDKFYDGVVFHRVIPDFMIQGGGFTSGMKEKTTRAPIKNEAGNGISNERGTLAMARTNDPDSASAQFFINLKNNTFLDRAKARDKVGYAVFGKVISGMDVVDKIAGVETGNRGGHQNVPLQDVVIKSVRRVEAK
jgi:cyclophilin family peptidyl-prolyl cis-trans isomerase